MGVQWTTLFLEKSWESEWWNEGKCNIVSFLLILSLKTKCIQLNDTPIIIFVSKKYAGILLNTILMKNLGWVFCLIYPPKNPDSGFWVMPTLFSV